MPGQLVLDSHDPRTLGGFRLLFPISGAEVDVPNREASGQPAPDPSGPGPAGSGPHRTGPADDRSAHHAPTTAWPYGAQAGGASPYGQDAPEGIRRYLARSRRDGRTAAVTAVRPDRAGEPRLRDWLEREARASAVAAGPWTLPLLDADPEAAVPWLAHSYLPALPLDEAVSVGGPLPELSVRSLGAALASALAALHAAGLAHSALSVRTVLLTAQGPRLTGLGHATAQADPAADVRALAAVLGFAATGRWTAPADPTGSGDVADNATAGSHGAAPTAVDFGPLSPELLALLRPALAGDPAHRPTAAGLLATLGEPVRVDGSVVPLPGPVVVRLAQQAAEALAAETADGSDVGGGHLDGGHLDGGDGGFTDPDGQPAVSADRGTDADAGASDRPTQQLRVIDPAAERPRPRPGPCDVLDPPTQRLRPLSAGPDAPAPDAPAPGAAVPGPRDGGSWAPPVPGTAHPGPPPVTDDGSAPSTSRQEPAAPEPRDAPPTPEASGPDAEAPGPPQPAAPASSRRGLLWATAGLLVGAGAVAGWVTGRGAGLDALTNPAGSPPAPGGTGPSQPPPGTPPTVRWRYDLPDRSNDDVRPLVWRNRIVVLVGRESTAGVDLTNGREVWVRNELGSVRSPETISEDLALVAEAGEWVAFSARTGEKRWSDRRYYQDGQERSDLVFQTSPGLLPPTQDGRTVFFVGRALVPQASTNGAEFFLVAFDTVRRRELWRAALPRYYESNVGARPGASSVVTMGYRDAVPELTSYRLADGGQEWRQTLAGLTDRDKLSLSLPRGLVYASHGGELRAYAHQSGQQVWSRQLVDYAGVALGGGIIRKVPTARAVKPAEVLFMPDSDRTVYAVDPGDGSELWRQSLRDNSVWEEQPTLETSHSGRTLFAATSSGVVALNTRTGATQWRFRPAQTSPSGYQISTAPGTAVVLYGTVVYALPAD